METIRAAPFMSSSISTMAIAQTVFQLRSILRDYDGLVIQSVRPQGYRMNACVEVLDPSAFGKIAEDAHSMSTLVRPERLTGGSAKKRMTQTIGTLCSRPTYRNLERAAAKIDKQRLNMPGSPQVQTLYAEISILRMIEGYIRPTTHLKKALHSLETANSLNPHVPQAWAAKGWLIGAVQGDIKGGLTAINQAIDADPTLGSSHFYKAWLLVGCGDIEGAIEMLERTPSDAVWDRYVYFLRGWLMHAGSRHDALRDFLHGQRSKYRSDSMFVTLYALNEVFQNSTRAAEYIVKAALKTSPADHNLTAALAWVYAASGRRTRALQLLNTANNFPHAYLSPVMNAAVYGAMNESESARAFLQIAKADGDPWYLVSKCDPRFQSIFQRTG